MVKRMGVAAGSLLLTLAFLLPMGALAEGGDIRIEQVQVEMPRVRAYVNSSAKLAADTQTTATLGGRTLAQEELRRYDAALDPTSYFFLVDCSTSTTWGQMEAFKAALTGFAQTMEPGATLPLITFGVDVQVLLQRETNPGTITNTMAGLAPDRPGTVFFDALAKAIDLSSQEDFALERKLAFIFSDLVDYNLGGHTKNAYVITDDAGTNVIDAPVQEFTLKLGEGGPSAAMDVPVPLAGRQ